MVLFDMGSVTTAEFTREFTDHEFSGSNLLGKLYCHFIDCQVAVVDVNREFWTFLIRVATYFESDDDLSPAEKEQFKKAAEWENGNQDTQTRSTLIKIMETANIKFESDRRNNPVNPLKCFRVLMEWTSALMFNVFEKQEFGLKAINGVLKLGERYKRFNKAAIATTTLSLISTRNQNQEAELMENYRIMSTYCVELFQLICIVPVMFAEWNNIEIKETVAQGTGEPELSLDDSCVLLGLIIKDTWREFLVHPDKSPVQLNDGNDAEEFFRNFNKLNDYLVTQLDGYQFLKSFNYIKTIQTEYAEIVTRFPDLYNSLVRQKVINNGDSVENYFMTFHLDPNDGTVSHVGLSQHQTGRRRPQLPGTSGAGVETANTIYGGNSDMGVPQASEAGAQPDNSSEQNVGVTATNTSPTVTQPGQGQTPLVVSSGGVTYGPQSHPGVTAHGAVNPLTSQQYGAQAIGQQPPMSSGFGLTTAGLQTQHNQILNTTGVYQNPTNTFPHTQQFANVSNNLQYSASHIPGHILTSGNQVGSYPVSMAGVPQSAMYTIPGQGPNYMFGAGYQPSMGQPQYVGFPNVSQINAQLMRPPYPSYPAAQYPGYAVTASIGQSSVVQQQLPGQVPNSQISSSSNVGINNTN